MSFPSDLVHLKPYARLDPSLNMKGLIYLSTRGFRRCLLVFLGISKKNMWEQLGKCGKLWANTDTPCTRNHQKFKDIFRYLFIIDISNISSFDSKVKKNTYPQLSTQVSTIFLFSVCVALIFCLSLRMEKSTTGTERPMKPPGLAHSVAGAQALYPSKDPHLRGVARGGRPTTLVCGQSATAPR